MEPVTHMLTGAVLARTGFHRRAAYATIAMTIAAELPDADMLWSFSGPLKGFMHHRGITHSFVGVPVEAAFLTAACWGVYRLRNRRAVDPAAVQPAAVPKDEAPPNWGLLFAGTLLALLSHILLDWTNNYGVRPFFPFNPHWYAGSFVFIFEPVLFLILLAALVLPPLFALINAEVGVRRHNFVSTGWAYTALALVAFLYGFRYDQREVALRDAAANMPGTLRAFASPHPINPWKWSTIAETSDAYHLSTINSRTGFALPPVPADTLYKSPTTLALLAAKRSALGKVYLDWSSYPLFMEAQAAGDAGHPLTEVTFMDVRFMYDSVLRDGRTNPPLSGSVLLDMQAPEGQRVVETRLDGKTQQ